MKRGKLCWVVVSAAMLGIGVMVRADPPATAPAADAAAAPATQPSTADAQALIRQLGDDDFKVRLNAVKQLKAMGKAAMPALKEARNSQNPEIQSQADELLGELERPPVDESAVPQPGPAAAGANVFSSSYSVSMGPGGRTIDITEPGRTIHIEEKPGALYMKVVGQVDGKPATREYKAKNPEQLKQEHPAAFVFYQQHAGNNRVGMINVQGNNVMIQQRIQINAGGSYGNINIAPGNAPGGGNIREIVRVNALQGQLVVKMRNAEVPAAQQQEMFGLIAKLRHAIPDPRKDAKELAAQKQAYSLAGEAVRAKIGEMKLGDFENLLPAKPDADKPAATQPDVVKPEAAKP